MNTVEEYDLRADLAAAIRGIEPRHPEYRDRFWAELDHPYEITSGKPRNFYPMLVPGTPDGELYGDGQTWTSEFRVYVSYVGVRDKTLESMIPMDGRQIFHTIVGRASPTVSGFIGPLEEGMTYNDLRDDEDQEGAQFGFFSLLIRYLAPSHARQEA